MSEAEDLHEQVKKLNAQLADSLKLHMQDYAAQLRIILGQPTIQDGRNPRRINVRSIDQEQNGLEAIAQETSSES